MRSHIGLNAKLHNVFPSASLCQSPRCCISCQSCCSPLHVIKVQSDLEVRATSSQVGQAPSWPVRCLTLFVLRVMPHGSRVPSLSHVVHELSDLTFRVHVPSFHLLPRRCFAYLLLPHVLSHHLPVLFARPWLCSWPAAAHPVPVRLQRVHVPRQ